MSTANTSAGLYKSELPVRPVATLRPVEEPRDQVVDLSLGALIRHLRELDDSQIERILAYQRQHQVRFGEAAVALKLASSDDVLWALSQQFHYPYPTQSAADGLNPELIVAIDPFCAQSEVFRDIRSQLIMGVLAAEHSRCALAVVSPSVGDGKTFFVANLAVAFSQLGGRTLVVDADMRSPRLHRIFDVPNRAGLSNILAGRADTAAIHAMSALPGLYLLPVGTVPPNPLELVQRPAFGLLLQELCNKFDHVLVDTSAASHGADARVLAAKCGAALVMGRRNSSRMDALRGLIDHLGKTPVRLAGVMLNEH
jgi:protein-tyrosine kinase